MNEELERTIPKLGLRRCGRWLRRLQWVIIPVAIFSCLESTARHWQRVQPPVKEDIWTTKRREIRPDLPVNYVFIGSSRVAAAVDERTFAAVMARELGHPTQALNFGHGYTCMVQHYLNLRNLGREHADQMHGCVVFIEAFGGLPEAGEWKSAWFYPRESQHLLPLLRPEDLPRLWASDMSPEDRLRLDEDVRVITDVLIRHCALLKNRDRISNELMAQGQRLFGKALSKVVRPRPAPPAVVADLRAAGGIRNDLDGLQLARKLAVDWAKVVSANQTPFRLNEQSVTFDLIRLVKDMGGQVVFYDTPIHSVQAGVYQTPVRLADRKFFREQLAGLGVTYLTPDFVARDEDIPDYWHLCESRSPEFTKALAKAWIEASRPRVTAQRTEGEATKVGSP
jgi:hypothetical protein